MERSAVFSQERCSQARCPVETNFNSIGHYVCHWLAHTPFQLLYNSLFHQSLAARLQVGIIAPGFETEGRASDDGDLPGMGRVPMGLAYPSCTKLFSAGCLPLTSQEIVLSWLCLLDHLLPDSACALWLLHSLTSLVVFSPLLWSCHIPFRHTSGPAGLKKPALALLATRPAIRPSHPLPQQCCLPAPSPPSCWPPSPPPPRPLPVP